MKQKTHSKSLHAFYAEKVEAFLRLYEHPGTKKKSIHRLRISMKHLHALFDLLGILAPETIGTKHYYRNYKKIFSTAGEVREAQVNKKAISGYKVCDKEVKEYVSFLQHLKKQAKKKFKKAVQQFHYKDARQSIVQVSNSIGALNRMAVNAASHDFIRASAEKIKVLLRSGHSAAVLHGIRKRMKSAGAIVELLNDLHAQQELKSLLKRIKAAEKCIGSWHDIRILNRSLKSFLKAKAKKHFPEIVELRKQLKKEDHQRRKQVRQETQIIVPMLLPM